MKVIMTATTGGIAVGPDGSIHVTGYTKNLDFYTHNAYDDSLGGTQDAFLLKIAPDGQLAFCTFLGGEASERAVDVAVDDPGFIYVVGYTSSDDFPTTPGAYDETHNSSAEDYFITKFTSDGQGLVVSTYLGGFQGEYYYGGIALDATYNVYVTGSTFSVDFPTVGAIYPTHQGGGHDIFFSKLSASRAQLMFSTYLGATNSTIEHGLDIVVDSEGAILVTGVTDGDDAPMVNAFDSYHGAEYAEVFLTKMAYNDGAQV